MKQFLILSSVMFTACAVPGLQLGGSATTPTPTTPSASPSESVPTTPTPPSKATERRATAEPAEITKHPAPAVKERSRDDDRVSFGAVWTANNNLILHREQRDTDRDVDAADLRKEAALCSERVKLDLARGVPPDETYYFDGRNIFDVSPSNAEEKVCKPLAVIADGWAARIAAREQREQASDAALAAPYKKAGMDGDKLAFILKHDGDVYLLGQIRATPQSAARASVLFVELVDGEGRTVVLRLTYAGNREVSRSSRAYIDPPGPSAYR